MGENENKCVNIDALNKYYAKKNQNTTDIEVEMCDTRVRVKRNVSISQFSAGVITGTNLCFDNGEYIPWIRDIAYMYAVIITFSDIEIDVNMEDEFFLLTVTTIFHNITDAINAAQLHMFEAAFDEQVESRLNKISCAREKELDEAISVLRAVAQKYNEAAAVFKEIMGSDLSDIISTFSKNAGALKESVGVLKEEFSKYVNEQGDISDSV